MRPCNQLFSATALVVLASVAGCKSDGGATGPTTLEGQYHGAMAGESSPSLSASLDSDCGRPARRGTITPVGAGAQSP